MVWSLKIKLIKPQALFPLKQLILWGNVWESKPIQILEHLFWFILKSFLPENSFLFLYHSFRFIQKTTQMTFSQDLQLSNFSIGMSQRASVVDRFNFNSMGLSVGLAIENFDFGVQYNFPFRQLNQVYSPSVFELYLTFDFSPFRRNNRGLFKRLQTDNY